MSDIRIKCGASELILAPHLGGRVRSWRYNGTDLIRPMSEDGFDLEKWPPAGAFPLIPFGLRIKKGRLKFGGREIALSLPEGGVHALHGIASRKAWQVRSATETSAELMLRHVGDRSWPWGFEASQKFTLRKDGLQVDLTLTNSGAEDMPGAIGWHPSFVKVASARTGRKYQWSFDDQQFPRERSRAEGQSWADQLLYLEETAATEMIWPSGLRLRSEATDTIRHAIVYDLEPDRTCWEPISHLPCADQGVTLQTVPTGGTVQGRMVFHVDVPNRTGAKRRC